MKAPDKGAFFICVISYVAKASMKACVVFGRFPPPRRGAVLSVASAYGGSTSITNAKHSLHEVCKPYNM
jgi:hypothetical protein